MTASLRVPHLGYMEDVRVDEAMKLISGKKELTLLSVLIKATSMALVAYPELNSAVDQDATELRMHSDHNIGIAMDTPRGLMVPVIHDVKNRSILDVSNALTRLKELGLNNKLSPSDLSNATFTLSNIGSVGGTYACPIIVPPQVAIGALGRAKRVPVFESATSMVVKEARIMPVSWSADHRVIDGATIAKFCNQFKFYVENPQEMTLRMV
jgi:2-oxoisovalerate dehydrogenase E2 component (dihydrolipoyl transacylase)